MTNRYKVERARAAESRERRSSREKAAPRAPVLPCAPPSPSQCAVTSAPSDSQVRRTHVPVRTKVTSGSRGSRVVTRTPSPPSPDTRGARALPSGTSGRLAFRPEVCI